MKDEKRSDSWAAVLFCIVLIYTLAAGLTFAFRHPWMTKTEQFIYTWRMLTWGTVDYDEARPRR